MSARLISAEFAFIFVCGWILDLCIENNGPTYFVECILMVDNKHIVFISIRAYINKAGDWQIIDYGIQNWKILSALVVYSNNYSMLSNSILSRSLYQCVTLLSSLFSLALSLNWSAKLSINLLINICFQTTECTISIFCEFSECTRQCEGIPQIFYRFIDRYRRWSNVNI